MTESSEVPDVLLPDTDPDATGPAATPATTTAHVTKVTLPAAVAETAEVSKAAEPAPAAAPVTAKATDASGLAETGIATWTWDLAAIGAAGIGLGSLVIGIARPKVRS
ncbi:MAG: hypothetical protein ACK5IM_08755 [Demequina sp.]